MTATYAGAVSAIRSRLAANWSTTPIAPQNAPFDTPVDGSNNPSPWVFLEVISTHSEIRAINTPGNHEWITIGLVLVHVFVPSNDGTDLAFQYADQIASIFRMKQFYNSDAGCAVWTRVPRTDGGSSDADRGNWFRVTMTCDFEFYFRG